MGYVSVGTGRPTQALKWTIAKSQASLDYEEKRLSVGRAISVSLLLLPLVLVLGGLLAWFAPSLLSAPTELAWTLRLATALLVANLIIVSLTGVPRSVLQGENQAYRRMGLSAALVFLGAGLTALALYMKTGLIGVTAVVLVTTLLSGALFLRIVRKYVPWFGIARPSFNSIRGFLGLSSWFLAWRLVIQLTMASDLIVLGVLTSLAIVTTYTLTKYTPEMLTSLVALAVGSVTPGLGGIIGSGNLQKAVRVRNEIMSLSWLVAIAMGTTIVMWNQDFVRMWIGEEYYVGSLVNLLIVLMVIQLVLIRNDAFMIDLTLDLRLKVIIGALSATISVVVAGILIAFLNLGIMGLCLGFIAGRSILSLAYPWLIGRFLGVALVSQLKDAVRPGVVTVLLLLLAFALSVYLIASTWISLIVSAGLTLAVASLFAFYSGLSGDRRRRILERAALFIRTVAAN